MLALFRHPEGSSESRVPDAGHFDTQSSRQGESSEDLLRTLKCLESTLNLDLNKEHSPYATLGVKLFIYAPFMRSLLVYEGRNAKYSTNSFDRLSIFSFLRFYNAANVTVILPSRRADR